MKKIKELIQNILLKMTRAAISRNKIYFIYLNTVPCEKILSIKIIKTRKVEHENLSCFGMIDIQNQISDWVAKEKSLASVNSFEIIKTLEYENNKYISEVRLCESTIKT